MSRDYLQHGRRHHPVFGSDPMNLGIEYAILNFSGSLAVASGGADVSVTWTEFDTTSTDVFGTINGSGFPPGSNTSGDFGLLLIQPGIYFAIADALWEHGTYDRASYINPIRGTVMGMAGPPYRTVETLSVNTFGGLTDGLHNASWQMNCVAGGGASAIFNLNCNNYDSGTRHVTSAIMSCIYWPVLDDLANVF